MYLYLKSLGIFDNRLNSTINENFGLINNNMTPDTLNLSSEQVGMDVGNFVSAETEVNDVHLDDLDDLY